MLLGNRKQRDRASLVTGTTGPADTVNVILGRLGYVIVYHMRDRIDIDAAGGHVGRNQHVGVTVFKTQQRGFTLRLRAVAVNAVRFVLTLFENVSDTVGTAFSACKYKHAVKIFLVEQIEEKRHFRLLCNRIRRLFDKARGLTARADLDKCRVFEHRIRNMLDLGRHCRREKESLAFRGYNTNDPFDRRQKAHIEHSVRLV